MKNGKEEGLDMEHSNCERGIVGVVYLDVISQ